ncbi:hypothetical protein BKN38_09435 [Helicobacter sp. CLO-3]|uniref:hypothetical protein n=1 Tax=unclassified Helicobacter TaxID=2593540 RepID=UPI00080502E7|nr:MULTISPECIES: hypothetical protein [unclassified Helicobacter]OBV28652.1 hypothetical protein BA723_08675 [Helicobacter sp. CLO-3]OHU81268.1 hypothetical protein BKN38_09435 [Helicobacter sp. CLO-3]
MILIGFHPRLYPSEFHKVSDLDSLKQHLQDKAVCDKHNKAQNKTQDEAPKAEYIIWFDAKDDVDFALCKYAQKEGIAFGVRVDNAYEFVACAHFAPKYLLVSRDYKAYQNIADSYLLDSKVLAIFVEDELGLIRFEGVIADLAKDGIDGVINANKLQ